MIFYDEDSCTMIVRLPAPGAKALDPNSPEKVSDVYGQGTSLVEAIKNAGKEYRRRKEENLREMAKRWRKNTIFTRPSLKIH
ncbi:MAG: hypothetical protein Q7S05_04020 [bacterium]|nr:hypothetical protein [bacterium]